MRIGNGYDVHRYVPGRKLILGGVDIAHEMGLEGHSDADVLVHAIMDAMLGAAALGDIGQHFPDTDEAYRGVSSLQLLRHAAKLLDKAGYAVVNMDSIIAAQRPKLMLYLPQMCKNIAHAAGLDTGQVSVKATTTERLGFVGREEGISAWAVVLIQQKERM